MFINIRSYSINTQNVDYAYLGSADPVTGEGEAIYVIFNNSCQREPLKITLNENVDDGYDLMRLFV